jgi:hypothetical protein
MLDGELSAEFLWWDWGLCRQWKEVDIIPSAKQSYPKPHQSHPLLMPSTGQESSKVSVLILSNIARKISLANIIDEETKFRKFDCHDQGPSAREWQVIFWK